MTVHVTKPSFNIREKLTELKHRVIRTSGHFTPEIIDQSGNKASYVYNFGYYERIGNLCYVHIDLRNINSLSLTGTDQLRIEGLPFKSTEQISGAQVFSIKVQNGVSWSTGAHLVAQVGQGSTAITLGYVNSGDVSFTGLTINNINGGTNRDIWINGTYLVG